MILLLFFYFAGMIFFAMSFANLMKNDEDFADMIYWQAETNPMGIILLSAYMVFWPITLIALSVRFMIR